MFTTLKKLILASASPRRQTFLRELGIDFTVSTVDIDESPMREELPISYVERIAKAKCAAVMDKKPDFWVLAADTTVFIDTLILGKPVDEADALRTLMRLSGREHRVATSYCLGNLQENIRNVETVETRVQFSSFSESSAKSYVKTGEPMDKAGSYGIQGVGAFMVKEIHGSYSNVVGLPLVEILSAFNKYGIVKTN